MSTPPDRSLRPRSGEDPASTNEYVVTRLDADGFAASLAGLAEVLVDGVDSGASLGFLAPFDHDAAAHWWRSLAPAVAAGNLLVWTSRSADGHLDGTISLVLEPKPNSAYRASVVKLIVHRRARGQGLGRRLLTTAEEAAAVMGRTLVMLDTETGSAADFLYEAAGWTRYGIVPEYAADPAGTPRDCSFYFKRLTC
jgi:ribosomal protein S18 acetylase RimI-like enzyme